jgi:hypothetical protein
MIEPKTFRTLIRIYSVFKNERVSANNKLTLHKALISSGMTYACPTWELVTDTGLLKLQHLQNKVLHTIENFSRCALVHDLHTAFNLQYVYDYITKLCKQQAEGIQNRENAHVCSTEQGKVRHRKYNRLKLGGSQAYDCSSD